MIFMCDIYYLSDTINKLLLEIVFNTKKIIFFGFCVNIQKYLNFGDAGVFWLPLNYVKIGLHLVRIICKPKCPFFGQTNQ